jgi:hypothetical protein
MPASLASLDRRFRPYARALVDAVARAGLDPQVTSTRRSRATQKKLYDAYLDGRSPFPAVPPGRSQHGVGLALDMTISNMSRMSEVGRLWESFGRGFRWGGRFGDPVHFDYKP